MAEKKHEELCNCSFCRNHRRKQEEAKQRKTAAKRKARARAKATEKGEDIGDALELEDDAPPHHFHTEYFIEAGPGEEGYEPDPSENSLKPRNEYRTFDRNVKLTMKNQRKMIASRRTKPPTSPTEAYQRMIGKK